MKKQIKLSLPELPSSSSLQSSSTSSFSSSFSSESELPPSSSSFSSCSPFSSSVSFSPSSSSCSSPPPISSSPTSPATPKRARRLSQIKHHMNLQFSSTLNLSTNPNKPSQTQGTRQRSSTFARLTGTKTKSSSSGTASSPSSQKSNPLDSIRMILREEHSYLTRCLVRTLARLEVPPLVSDSDYKKKVTKFLMELHGNFLDLFYFSFLEELDQVKQLATVMRERTACVLLLQSYWSLPSHSIAHLAPPQLGSQFTKKKIDSLLASSDSKEERSPRTLALKENLISCVRRVLLVEKYPQSICCLCYQCYDAIQTNPRVEVDEETSVKHWTVTSFIFLRSLIPIITGHGQEGHKFLGRFFMKLSCKSFFSNGDCLANEALRECFPLFEKFCTRIFGVGRKNFPFTSKSPPLSKEDPKLPKAKAELSEILSSHSREISSFFFESEDAATVFKWKDRLRLLNNLLTGRKSDLVLGKIEPILIKSTMSLPVLQEDPEFETPFPVHLTTGSSPHGLDGEQGEGGEEEGGEGEGDVGGVGEEEEEEEEVCVRSSLFKKGT
mmetsp:Transcript_14204/g.19668  ORF Transcript_14204/g.19668 Transcript_14204/m.19668 type:complete len:554 (+) Transcript_14204:191-1852(+)